MGPFLTPAALSSTGGCPLGFLGWEAWLALAEGLLLLGLTRAEGGLTAGGEDAVDLARREIVSSSGRASVKSRVHGPASPRIHGLRGFTDPRARGSAGPRVRGPTDSRVRGPAGLRAHEPTSYAQPIAPLTIFPTCRAHLLLRWGAQRGKSTPPGLGLTFLSIRLELSLARAGSRGWLLRATPTADFS